MDSYLKRVVEIWMAGGWTMIPIGMVSLLIYGMGTRLFVYFSQRGFKCVPDSEWSRWIACPEEGEGEVGELIRYTQDEAADAEAVQNRFSEIISAKIPEVDRQLVFMNVLVAAAPLLGLLGTVLGMLDTFQGISAGGAKTVDLISSGISKALITTEMGLLVALPGYLMASMLKTRRNQYEAFLARVESMTVQHFRKGRRRPIPARAFRAALPIVSEPSPAHS